MKKLSLALSLVACVMLAGCSNQALHDNFPTMEPKVKTETNTGKALRNLPKADRKAVVAVYDFEDQTGQHKPNDRIAEFSRAVTQGGAAILNEALTKAGNGSWFRVIERKGLENLLRERQIIAATRKQYTNSDAPLPPMLYAGLLLEGGIVAYETNTITGGLGARYLGIGGNSEYRQDVVTVYLRAVNVQNGEIMVSTNSSKTIFSTAVGGSVFKFVAFDEILEIESGFTVNEPPQLAVRQAIESAVHSLVLEGANSGLWNFANAAQGRQAINQYRREALNQEIDEPKINAKPQQVSAPALKVQPPMPTRPKINSQPLDNYSKPRANAIVVPPASAPVTMPTQLPSAEVNNSITQRMNTIEPIQVPASAQPRVVVETPRAVVSSPEVSTVVEGANSERRGEAIGNRRYESRINDYEAVGRGDEKLFCDAKGCYPFKPVRH